MSAGYFFKLKHTFYFYFSLNFFYFQRGGGGGGVIDIKGEAFKVRKNPAFITLYICRELIILIYVLISLFTFIILLPPHYLNFLDFPVKGPKVCHFYFFFTFLFTFLKKIGTYLHLSRLLVL